MGRAVLPNWTGLFPKNSLTGRGRGQYNRTQKLRCSTVRGAKQNRTQHPMGYGSDEETGRCRASGAEGAAKTLRQKDRFRTRLRRAGDAPKRQSAPAENLSGRITEALYLAWAKCGGSAFLYPENETRNGKGVCTMERKTPLYDVHVEEGGKIVPFAGYLLPASLMSPTWERSSSPAPRPWIPSTTCSPTTTTAWR